MASIDWPIKPVKKFINTRINFPPNFFLLVIINNMRTSPALKAITVINFRRSSSSSFLHTCRLGRERLLFSNNFEALFARRTTPFRLPQARFRSCKWLLVCILFGYLCLECWFNARRNASLGFRFIVIRMDNCFHLFICLG